MTVRPAYLALSLTLAASGAAAQADPAVASFLARARAGTDRYHDPSVAVADGYRVIGPEAPAMGQHWVQPGLLVAGRFDPDHPPILEYATVRGTPLLVGIAYALPLGPGESAPDVPAGPGAWHSHAGDVEEESLRLAHEDPPTRKPGERVAVLHVWAWLENPAGPFAPLNWALPYVRAGLEPRGAPEATAKALSLDDGGTGFWQAALARALDSDAAHARAIERVLAAYADTVAAWRRRRGGEPRVSDDEAAWLDALWDRTRSAVRALLGAGARDQLAMLAGF